MILAASQWIHANDKLGIGIGDFSEITKFPFQRGFVGKQIGDLIVTKGGFFFSDKVNFPSAKMAYPNLIATGTKMMINGVLKQLPNVARTVTGDRIAKAQVAKVNFVVHFKQSTSTDVIALGLVNKTSLL